MPKKKRRPQTQQRDALTRVQIIALEDSNDPLSRGYASMTPDDAAADWNDRYRPGPGDVGEVRDLLIFERTTSTQGLDSVPTNLMGRIQQVSESGVGDDPYGTQIIELTLDQIHAAKAMTAFLAASDVARSIGVDFRSDPRFEQVLDSLVSAQAISSDDKEAIQALSDERLTRGEELGVGQVVEGDIIEARKL